MKVYCQSCGTKIKRGRINKRLRFVYCHSCKAVHSLDDLFPERHTHRRRKRVDPTPDIEIVESEEGLKVTKDWHRLNLIFIGIALLFFTGGSSSIIESLSTLTIQSILGLLITVIPTMLLFYFGAACLLNKTILTVTSNKIVIRHTPVHTLFYRDRAITLGSITQLYTKRVWGEDSDTFDLYLIDGGNRHIKILENNRKKEPVLYIEQEIEKYLGIEDRDVPGSVRE